MIVDRILEDLLVKTAVRGVRAILVPMDDLTPEQQRVFVEVVAAAIVFDGKQSAIETDWLAKRNARVVEEALRVAGESLPPDSTDDVYAEYVRHRHEALESEAVRERAFETSVMFLLAGPGGDREGRAWRVARRFGESLHIDTATVGSAIRRHR